MTKSEIIEQQVSCNCTTKGKTKLTTKPSQYVDPIEFHTVHMKLRKFFIKKGFIEVPTQSRLSILAACEDPTTIAQFEYTKTKWPLPQTGQMWLEYDLFTTLLTSITDTSYSEIHIFQDSFV
jgi:aspartyl/asparaginyl-tRNA synthetase